MEIIKILKLTKDYGNKRGNFNVSFSVNKGEILGFLGPNGAGKTTTIRHLMGFIKPDSGSVSIKGMDCFKDSSKIQESLGYLPGEIAFMDDMTGDEFIKFVGEMKGITDFSYAEKLKEFFEIDPRSKIKKMSKGMKQKIGIICAFMGDPDIL
ncbi:MAG: ABC transporter ATP-binding protein, partial [Clostridium sp.]